MPWIVKKVMDLQDRIPACPDCTGRLTVRHVVGNFYHCTCDTLFEAIWTDDPRVMASLQKATEPTPKRRKK